MNGKLLNKLLQLGCKHALYREDGKWYHNLTDFPGVLFDKHGYLIFMRKNYYVNHPNLQIKRDLHIIGGLNSILGYNYYTDNQKKIIDSYF